MPLTTVRQEAATRFLEVQTFLSAIKALEGGTAHTTELNARKGLFLVLLYGAFEYSMNRTFTEATMIINNHNVEYNHVSTPLYALALDPQLTSCAAVGPDLRWKRRAELFDKQVSADHVELLDGAFLPQLENVWAHTIAKMFNVFGITLQPLYDPKVRQYINQVVEKRNAVAHGREAASAVGQAYTTGDLQNLLDELSRQAQYIFAAFEGHITAKAFVKLAHQHLY
jgi:hypothetical protein